MEVDDCELVVTVLVAFELRAYVAATAAITITIMTTKAETILEIADSFLRYKVIRSQKKFGI